MDTETNWCPVLSCQVEARASRYRKPNSKYLPTIVQSADQQASTLEDGQSSRGPKRRRLDLPPDEIEVGPPTTVSVLSKAQKTAATILRWLDMPPDEIEAEKKIKRKDYDHNRYRNNNLSEAAHLNKLDDARNYRLKVQDEYVKVQEEYDLANGAGSYKLAQEQLRRDERLKVQTEYDRVHGHGSYKLAKKQLRRDERLKVQKEYDRVHGPGSYKLAQFRKRQTYRKGETYAAQMELIKNSPALCEHGMTPEQLGKAAAKVLCSMSLKEIHEKDPLKKTGNLLNIFGNLSLQDAMKSDQKRAIYAGYTGRTRKQEGFGFLSKRGKNTTPVITWPDGKRITEKQAREKLLGETGTKPTNHLLNLFPNMQS